MAKRGNGYITALDLGTTKVVCFIAEVSSDWKIKIIGIGHQVSQGIKSGIITNIQKAESSIRAAVGAAEQMAGINVDKVTLNISGCKQQSFNVNVQMDVNSQEITSRDIVKLLEQGCEQYRTETREVIHCTPCGFSIDGSANIQDPLGMYGQTLEASLHIITASTSAIFNLANCLAHCHLDIEDYIASSYASGLSCLTEDEKNLGVTLLDLGGGNSSIAVFKGGNLVFSDTLPYGGGHVTNDIALGLSCNSESAERTKTLYGNVIKTSHDEQELIDIIQNTESGESETNTIQRAKLVGIIQPRIEEIFEMIYERLDKSGFRETGSHMVITGGASQLAGVKAYAAQLFQKQVRIGSPHYIDGMAESTKGSAFSTCAGILQFIVEKNTCQSYTLGGKHLFDEIRNPFHKVIQWFKENF